MSVLLGLVLLLVVEVAAVVAVAREIGLLATIALLAVVSLSGPWLVRRAGFGAWRRAQARLAEGAALERELLDGLLLLLGGLLVCIPGFVTDAAGILLLVPPVRALVGRRITRRLAHRVVARFGGPAGSGRWRGGAWGGGTVLDAASHPGAAGTPGAGPSGRAGPDGPPELGGPAAGGSEPGRPR